MRKSFVIFLCLMVCSVAALCLLPGYVMREADQVQVVETVIYGDPSVAEGVTVTSHNHYEGLLYWDTTYVAGREPVVQTEHRYSGTRENIPIVEYSPDIRQGVELSNIFSAGFEISSSRSLDVEQELALRDSTELFPAYMELMKETEAGETKSKTIHLKEYLDYYPLEVAFALPGKEGTIFAWEEITEAFCEFFKVPVLEEELYKIELGKGNNGNVVSFGGRSTDSDRFVWNVVSTCTETDFYFTFQPYSVEGKRMDTGLIPGGYGIYRQPYSIKEVDGAEEVEMDSTQLEMIFPLEDEEYAYGSMFLDINEIGQLVILTEGKNATYLLVVDTDSRELVQKVEITRPEGADRFYISRVTEEFILLYYLPNNNLPNYFYVLIDWKEERGYEQQFMIPVENPELYWELLAYNGYVNAKDMDWNGERLAFVCYNRYEYGGLNNCNYDLLVYDKTGLLYHGRYLNSLLTEQESTEYTHSWDKACQPRPDVAIDVEWSY